MSSTQASEERNVPSKPTTRAVIHTVLPDVSFFSFPDTIIGVLL